MRRTASLSFVTLFATGIAFCVALYAVSEAQAATYSQTVDNATSGRFSASGKWIKSDYSSQRYGKNYRVLKKPGSTSAFAKYKVKTPARGYYKISARWPANSGYNNRTKYRIKTPSGWKVKTVNQRKNGGSWRSLGTYKLNAGDFQRIKISSKSSGSGFIIADAVRITRVPPPTNDSGGSTSTTGGKIVTEAKTWIGVPYKYGGNDRNGIDCSGLVNRVYNKVGINMTERTTSTQWGVGTRVYSPAPGDLVFFGRSASNISSVGIYTGPDRAIKATVPGDKVRSVSIKETKNAVGGWVGYRHKR